MISRVAEHCFWLARYLERAENIARVLEVNQTLLLDFEVPIEQQWKPILIISGIHKFPKEAESEAVQDFLTWDRDNPFSIASSLGYARENARIIRELISEDMWERINFYFLWLQGGKAKMVYDNDRTGFYNQIKRINQLLFGIAEGTVSHGEAWEFFKLGKYLERACQTGRILDVKYHLLLPSPDMVGTPIDSAQWMAILKSCSGYEPFHKQRQTLDKGTSVADFLIFDPIFPRSIRRCLWYCQEASHKISGRKKGQLGNEVERILEELVDWLNLVNIDDFVTSGLHESLTRAIDTIHRIGDAIHRTYFDFHHPRLESSSTFRSSQSQTQTRA